MASTVSVASSIPSQTDGMTSQSLDQVRNSSQQSRAKSDMWRLKGIASAHSIHISPSTPKIRMPGFNAMAYGNPMAKKKAASAEASATAPKGTTAAQPVFSEPQNELSSIIPPDHAAEIGQAGRKDAVTELSAASQATTFSEVMDPVHPVTVSSPETLRNFAIQRVIADTSSSEYKTSKQRSSFHCESTCSARNSQKAW